MNVEDERACAAMLADVPVGKSPIGGSAVIPDDEKGDRLAGSAGVKVPGEAAKPSPIGNG
jgi:hypothetical protein